MLMTNRITGSAPVKSRSGQDGFDHEVRLQRGRCSGTSRDRFWRIPMPVRSSASGCEGGVAHRGHRTTTHRGDLPCCGTQR